MNEIVLLNGVPSEGLIPVTDSSVLRGDGCFEVVKSYRGSPFRLDDHLERLARSASLLEIDFHQWDRLADWVRQVTRPEGEAAVRIVLTRGPAVPGADDPEPNAIVFSHLWDTPADPASLLPVSAPWHAAGEPWELAGAKVLSYAPNLAATRRARSEGFDDALLVTPDGVVLEGPTFSIAWVCEGRIETPGLGLGILESVTRRVMFEIAESVGIDAVAGEWGLERLGAAEEVMAVSTIREIQSVSRVGTSQYRPGRVTAVLGDRFRQLVRG